jgi:2-keto-3-deoxy-L-rhamnonate aldolase RhmA
MLNLKNVLKQKLAAGETCLGMWVTLESPTITEIAVALGLDWVVIDAEHGHLDLKEIVEHLRVTHNTPTTAIVRVQEIEQGVIKRVLDVGADGIIVPQIVSAEEVERAVQFAKYPPWGIRGVGGERATAWGLKLADYTKIANDETLVISMMETVQAEADLDNILKVRGLDGFYFGPADFSSTAGYLGQWEGPGVAERLVAIKDKSRASRIPSGIICTSIDDAIRRKQQGFQMLGLAADTGLIIRALREAIEKVRLV